MGFLVLRNTDCQNMLGLVAQSNEHSNFDQDVVGSIATGASNILL